MKSDWAETKAMELHGTGEKFRRNVHINATAQALREAEARGMERASELADSAYGLATSLEERAEYTSGWNASAHSIATNLRVRAKSMRDAAKAGAQ